jgi:hypothetical protein
MARPINAAPPDKGHAPADVGLDLLPFPQGAPNDAAPAYFEALDPPPAEADMGIDTAMEHVPDLDFFGLS